VTPIVLTEGVWDSKTVAAQFALGPFADAAHPAGKHARAPADQPAIMVVCPSSCFKGRMHVDKGDGLRLTSLAENLLAGFSKMGVAGVGEGAAGRAEVPREKDKDRHEWKRGKDEAKRGKREGDAVQGELGGWIQKHCTQSLPEALSQVGGITLLLRAMHGSSRQDLQVAALRVLAQVLVASRGGGDGGEAAAAFWRLRGDLVVLYILFHGDAPDEPLFDILLQVPQKSPNTGERAL
jgi:hypothetical protein